MEHDSTEESRGENRLETLSSWKMRLPSVKEEYKALIEQGLPVVDYSNHMYVRPLLQSAAQHLLQMKYISPQSKAIDATDSLSPVNCPQATTCDIDPHLTPSAPPPLTPSNLVNVPDELRSVLRILCEGRTEPINILVPRLYHCLVREIHWEAEKEEEDVIIFQTSMEYAFLRNSIPLLCDRKALGAITRPPNRSVSRLDDTTAECLWTWESLGIDGFPLSLRDEIKTSREARDRISRRAKSLHKLICAIESGNVAAVHRCQETLTKLEQRDFKDLEKQQRREERRRRSVEMEALVELRKEERDRKRKLKEEEKRQKEEQKEEEKRQKEEEKRQKEEEKRQKEEEKRQKEEQKRQREEEKRQKEEEKRQKEEEKRQKERDEKKGSEEMFQEHSHSANPLKSPESSVLITNWLKRKVLIKPIRSISSYERVREFNIGQDEESKRSPRNCEGRPRSSTPLVDGPDLSDQIFHAIDSFRSGQLPLDNKIVQNAFCPSQETRQFLQEFKMNFLLLNQHLLPETWGKDTGGMLPLSEEWSEIRKLHSNCIYNFSNLDDLPDGSLREVVIWRGIDWEKRPPLRLLVTKKPAEVRAWSPLRKESHIDYELDSEEEWEDLFGGEDVEGRDEEEENEDDHSSSDESEAFVVPDNVIQYADEEMKTFDEFQGPPQPDICTTILSTLTNKLDFCSLGMEVKFLGKDNAALSAFMEPMKVFFPRGSKALINSMALLTKISEEEGAGDGGKEASVDPTVKKRRVLHRDEVVAFAKYCDGRVEGLEKVVNGFATLHPQLYKTVLSALCRQLCIRDRREGNTRSKLYVRTDLWESLLDSQSDLVDRLLSSCTSTLLNSTSILNNGMNQAEEGLSRSSHDTIESERQENSLVQIAQKQEEDDSLKENDNSMNSEALDKASDTPKRCVLVEPCAKRYIEGAAHNASSSNVVPERKRELSSDTSSNALPKKKHIKVNCRTIFNYFPKP